MMPQQPLHACMFPKSRGNTNFTSVSNPYHLEIEGRQIVGTAGQNIKDIHRYSNVDNALDALRMTLTWSHIAPTCPDTLACYPYYQSDPFIMTELPHIYFAGNCEKFESELLQKTDGSKTRLICIPNFKETKTGVLVNLKDLKVTALHVDC